MTKIWEDSLFIVYSKEDDGELCLYVHQKIQGVEILPLGYLLGFNSLIFGPSTQRKNRKKKLRL